MVCDIEANDGCVEANVGLSEMITNKILSSGENFLQLVKGFEYFRHSLRVCFLRGRKTALVHAICKITTLSVRSRPNERFGALFTSSYTQVLSATISPRSDSGYRSKAAFSGGRKSLNEVLRMRMISDDSLFTIFFVLMSHKTGTVYLQRIEQMCKKINQDNKGANSARTHWPGYALL